MTSDLTAEWQDLVRRAREALRAGSRPPLRHKRVMQVVRLPSFDPWSRYELFASSPSPEDDFVAVYSTWGVQSEMQKFANPIERMRHPNRIEPAIEQKAAVADPDAARLLLDSLKRITVPVVPEGAQLGLDGITVEVAFGEGLNELRVRWWHRPPSGWDAVERAADELMGLVLRATA